MTTRSSRPGLRSWLTALGAIIGFAGPVQSQAGSITGKVTDQSSGQPLSGARIQATGTNYVATTSQEGTYTLRGVSPGPYALRVIMLGYASQQKTVSVAAGQAAAVDWMLGDEEEARAAA